MFLSITILLIIKITTKQNSYFSKMKSLNFNKIFCKILKSNKFYKNNKILIIRMLILCNRSKINGKNKICNKGKDLNNNRVMVNHNNNINIKISVKKLKVQKKIKIRQLIIKNLKKLNLLMKDSQNYKIKYFIY